MTVKRKVRGGGEPKKLCWVKVTFSRETPLPTDKVSVWLV